MNKKMPILVQLIVGFSLILIIVMTLTTYFSYRLSSQVVLDKTSQYLQESVIQMSGKIDVALQEYDKLTQMVAYNPNIQDYFKKVNNGEKTQMSKYEIERFIGEQNRFLGSDSLSLIHLTDNVGGSYSINTALSVLWASEQEMEALPWYAKLEEYKGRMIWMYGEAWSTGKISAVIGARQLNNWESLEKLGNLFVVFPVEQLDRMIGSINLGESGKIQIVDEFGRVVYSTDSQEIGSAAHADLLAAISDPHRKMQWWDKGEKPSYLVHSESKYSGWQVVAYIDADEAVNSLDKMSHSIMIIGLFGILAALLFTTFFSWTLSRPIRLLAKRLQRLEKGFVNPSTGKLSNREVTILYDSFNDMLAHLNTTVKDLSDKKISEKQAQLIALKAQFRPHFLYNSLNTIYWSLINDGLEKEARMVLSLSNLLRYSIQPGSELVTVEEDLGQLERYIEISKMRYGDKLNTEINIGDSQILKLRMMKLLLQPLVENAITHGLEPIKGAWHIHIRIVMEDELLHFVVEDNGVGMSDEEMEKAVQFHGELDHHRLMHSGLGLSNLNYRIGIIYGKEYGLQLSKSELGGLRVDVKIPLTDADQMPREE